MNGVEPAVNEVPEFTGGVNPADAPVAENPEFNGGVNDDSPTTQPNNPEFNGGVNGVEPAVNEVPEFTGGVNDDNPTTQPNNPEFNGGVNGVEPAVNKVPEFNGGVNGVEPAVNEVPEFTGGVNGVEPAVNKVPEFTGGVNDGDAPSVPNKPEGKAPKSEAEKKIDVLKTEIAALEANIKEYEKSDLVDAAEYISAAKDALEAKKSALARAEKEVKKEKVIYKVLTPTVPALPKASEALRAEVKDLEEKLKTVNASEKEGLNKKLEALKSDLSLVEKAEKIDDLVKTVEKLEKDVADFKESDAEQAGDYLAAAEKDLEAKKAELDQAKKDLVAALHAEPKKEEPVKPAPSEDAKVEALQNKVADLEKEVARLESDLKDAEENNVEDYVKEGLEKAITEKKAELEKAEAELEEALKALDPVESSNGDALVQPEVPEFGANNPEIKKILKEIDKVKEQIKDAEENGAEPYYIEGLNNDLNDLLKALDILSKNLAAVNEVPEFNGEVPNQAEPTPQPQPAGDTGAPAGGQAAAPAEGQAAAPTEGQKAKDEKVLPNTGMNTSNTAALGLSLIGLIGLAIRRKLSK